MLLVKFNSFNTTNLTINLGCFKKGELRDYKRVMSPIVLWANPSDPTKTLILKNKA